MSADTLAKHDPCPSQVKRNFLEIRFRNILRHAFAALPLNFSLGALFVTVRQRERQMIEFGGKSARMAGAVRNILVANRAKRIVPQAIR